MDRLRERVPDAGDGAEGVRARAQVGHRAQVLEGVALLRDRIGLGVVHFAEHPKRARLHLDALALALGSDQFAFDGNGAARAEFGHGGVVVEGLVGNDLQIAEAAAVVDGDEAETALGGATGAHPALNTDLRPDSTGAVERIRYAHKLHG